jgi:hypothetical protein
LLKFHYLQNWRIDFFLKMGWRSAWSLSWTRLIWMETLTKTKTTTNIRSLKHQEQCLNMISNEEFWLLIQTFSVQVMNFNHNCECYLYIFWINIVNIPSYRPEELHGYHSSFNFYCFVLYDRSFLLVAGFFGIV